MNNAIVIFYDGDKIDQAGAEMIIGALAKYIAEGSSHPEIRVFDSAEIAKELLHTSNPPHLPCEEGDDAVRVVMTTIPVNMLDHPLKLAVFLTKKLEECKFEHAEKDRAFIKAMSILSQNFPVSREVVEKYGFNSDIRKTIEQTYHLYLVS